ncbi:MAG: carbonic anhydrase [Candidatus Brocadiales bacterium]
MAKEHGTFCTAINCMDGRVQRPVFDYMNNLCDTAYVDMITAPGPDGIVAKEGAMYKHIQSEVAISVEKHASNVVAIVGHYDCAGNPVSKEKHWEDIRDSVSQIQSWSLPIKVIGLWVNENWEVEPVA